MAADVKSIQVYKDAKNLVLVKFEMEEQAQEFVEYQLLNSQTALQDFLNDDTRSVMILALNPGTEVEVVKMESSKGEDVV